MIITVGPTKKSHLIFIHLVQSYKFSRPVRVSASEVLWEMQGSNPIKLHSKQTPPSHNLTWDEMQPVLEKHSEKGILHRVGISSVE